MHQPTKICALPWVDQQFFKPAISTHQILSKTFFREGDPSPAAYCRKLSYFCQVKLFYTKKENPPRAQRAAVTKLRHFEGFCRFEVVCVVCCVCSVVCLVLSLCVLSVVCGSVSALPQCCCSTAPVLPQYRPSAHPVLVQYLHSIDPVLPQYCPSTAPVLPQYLVQCCHSTVPVLPQYFPSTPTVLPHSIRRDMSI